MSSNSLEATAPSARQLRRAERRDEEMPRVGGRGRRTAVRVAEQIALVGAALIALIPLYAMVVTSLKRNSEFAANPGSLALPRDPTLSNFTKAWTDLDFASQLANTLLLSVTSAVVATAVSVLAGYGLARLSFRGRRWMVVGTVSLMSVPAIVVIVPLFNLMVDLNLINTFPAAVIVEIGLGIPFGTYLMFTFMRDLPSELFEAAQMEGASHWQQLTGIAIPLSRPVIATVALVTAVFAWNDLLVPLILWQSEDLRVLMVGLADLAPGRQGGVDVPLSMAGVTISVLPLIVLFLGAKRYFVRGLTEGAIK